MDYLKIEDVANKWGLSTRRVQVLCSQGKVEGAFRFGRDWMIPKDANRPTDGRTKAGRKEALNLLNVNLPLPRKTPFLYMSDLYNTPGTAEESILQLSDNHEAQVLFAAEIAYSRGEIDKVYESANYLLNKHSGFYAVLSAGMLLALCAIWHGDLNMWRKAKMHIAEAPGKTDKDRDIMAFSITAVDSMLYNIETFPEWFKIGRFEVLPDDALPAAKVFYAKYLYAVGYALATKQIELPGVYGLSLLTIIPSTIEPMISQAMADKSLIAEIYLRMTCAAVYNTIGNDEQAIYHIDRAIALALPDKLYGLLAEYCRALYPLLENRLTRLDPDVWNKIKSLYKIYNTGWSKLSGCVRGKTIITTLSQREREVAKLASFGLQNSEIAEKLHMSLSGVKQAIRIVSEKTGVSRDEFAAFL
ncbi:MAG: hypothetical protein J6B37_04065 [Clostridia bacterium]|nr:hypothetical protein [Clostridia bacterium]